MGKCQSKMAPEFKKESNEFSYDTCMILLNNKFEIVDYEDNINLLGYHTEDVLKKPIMILMNETTAKKHEKLFEVIHDVDAVKLQRKIQNTMNNIRIFNVRRKDDYMVPCMIDIEIRDTKFVVKLSHVPKQTIYNCPSRIIEYLDGEKKLIMKKYHNVICINIDIANSTKFVSSTDSDDVMIFYYKFNSIIETIVKQYYPFVNIHETCGDAYLLLMNVLTHHDDSRRLSLEICGKIYKDIEKFLNQFCKDMYIRIGITEGTITSGTVDGKTFRIFGEVIHRACRLESICERGHICLDKEYHDKIAKYKYEFGISKETHQTKKLKGLAEKTEIIQLCVSSR
jgi:class 3 adenylate cyclase